MGKTPDFQNYGKPAREPRPVCMRQNKGCHCVPAGGGRQSVSLVPPWLPLRGSCHEVTERVKTLSPPLRGTSPKGKAGVRIATPALRRWFAMTCCIRKCSEKPKDCDRRESLEGCIPVTCLFQSPRSKKSCPAKAGQLQKAQITAGFPGRPDTDAPSAPPGRR